MTLAGVVTPDSLAAKRPYIIVAAFVVGMLLTPPDVISQTLLALPMWVLFELGVFLSRIILRRKAEDSNYTDTGEKSEFERLEHQSDLAKHGNDSDHQ